MRPLGIVGIALGMTVSAYVTAVLLLNNARRMLPVDRLKISIEKAFRFDAERLFGGRLRIRTSIAPFKNALLPQCTFGGGYPNHWMNLAQNNLLPFA